jgi:hypothetical protein
MRQNRWKFRKRISQLKFTLFLKCGHYDVLFYYCIFKLSWLKKNLPFYL